MTERLSVFASVGSMLPFDRFVRAVDDWAAANRDIDTFLQIGEGDYEPRHAPFARMVPLDDYRQRLAECSLFVAHVGMGSILQALEIGKQMLMLPRQAALREHTTDHQLHTAAKFRDTPGLLIVDDEVVLAREMSRLLHDPLSPGARLSPTAPADFTNRIAAFLSGATKPFERA